MKSMKTLYIHYTNCRGKQQVEMITKSKIDRATGLIKYVQRIVMNTAKHTKQATIINNKTKYNRYIHIETPTYLKTIITRMAGKCFI